MAMAARIMRAREAKAIERASEGGDFGQGKQGGPAAAAAAAAPFRVSIESNASLDRPRDVGWRFK